MSYITPWVIGSYAGTPCIRKGMAMSTPDAKSDSPVWEKAAFSIIAGLILAGVLGLWSMSINVGRLEERVAAWTVLYEKRFDGMDKKFERYEMDQRGVKDELYKLQPRH